MLYLNSDGAQKQRWIRWKKNKRKRRGRNDCKKKWQWKHPHALILSAVLLTDNCTVHTFVKPTLHREHLADTWTGPPFTSSCHRSNIMFETFFFCCCCFQHFSVVSALRYSVAFNVKDCELQLNWTLNLKVDIITGLCVYICKQRCQNRSQVNTTLPRLVCSSG